jgi:ATP-dependent exoDNAse (exonuclease V) beta subunit
VTWRGLPDAAARGRALDPLRSCIVQAPAGSGKTGLLIQRYLLLLALVDAPEEVVAITFTIKAAGEMRERVLAALSAARAGRASEEEHEARTLELAAAAALRDAQLGWGLAENPARLRIQTIDALCASLARQMPILSRFGASPETIEDASELYLEAARSVAALVHSQDAAALEVEHLLGHLDNDVGRAEALLAGMLARRDHWVRHIGRLDRPALEAALVQERERVIDQARSLYPGAPSMEGDKWQALAKSLLTKKAGWLKRSREAQALAALPHGEALREALTRVLAMPPAAYSDTQWAALAAIGRLLPHALAALKVVFQSHGQVDFTEVAQAAFFALGGEDSPTDLALALDYRIRHLLVDEFQDTSITQYHLVARLTAGWEPGDGRTLFAVGDPMQSIYRFREAEVGEFLRTRERARIGDVALDPVRLTANFRSQAGIVEWVNVAFARVMPAHEDPATGAVPYAPSVPVRTALPGAAVEVHPFFDRDEAGEATRVVDLVARVRCDEPGARVAVLVRTRTHLREIVPRLRAAGLRFRAIEIDALGERPVVRDLLALTRALAHPADRLAWLAVLRAPWCGLTLADLAALAGHGSAHTVWESMHDDLRVACLSAEGRARLARLRDVLGVTLARRMRGTLRSQVEHAWLALGGPACVADATGLEDADVYLDALESAEETGSLPDLAAFEERVARLWALPDVRARDDDVQIMTIHKAKGLEFDHVIVPGLGRTPQHDEKRLFLWIERPAPGDRSTLLVAPIEEAGGDGDAIYAWLRALDQEREGHEAVRLLYVAATRARRRLHLLGVTATDRESGAACEPGASTLLATLWPIVASRFAEAAAKRDDRIGAVERVPLPLDQNLRRLAAHWRLAPPPPGPELVPPADLIRAQDEIEYSWVGETARHVGSVVHRWLQRIGDAGLDGWDDARIECLRAAVRAELTLRNVRESEREGAVERALAALRRAISDPRGRWVLGPHPEAASEHRLTALVDGRIVRLAIDRWFRDASGARWIVDYKTSSHEGANADAFLDGERERYAGQLERYALALGGVDGLGLYFPLLGAWREV